MAEDGTALFTHTHLNTNHDISNQLKIGGIPGGVRVIGRKQYTYKLQI
jgi:hypothetical protein